MKKMHASFLVLMLFFGFSTALAQVTVRANLSGAEEVPPDASNATGEAIFVVYPDRIEYSLTARNLGTAVSASHIHLGFPGANGPVFIFLFNSTISGEFPGTVTGTLTPADLIPLPTRGLVTWQDAVGAILGGRTYANLHTARVPGGEIRGQIESQLDR